MNGLLRSRLVLTVAALLIVTVAVVIPLSGSILHPHVAHADSSGWTIVPSPNVASAYNSLSGVSGTSISDAWAVGGSSTNNNWSQLIMHWDGSQWSLNSFADNGDPVSYLFGAAAISQADVWAVGYGGSQSNPYVSGTHPLVEHYLNGTWSIISTPTLNGSLWGVAAVSSSDVWAVGYDVDTNNELIEHWNGSSWSVIPPPVRTTAGALLHSITVVSATNIWAVGTNNWYGRDGQAIADEWNGTSWVAKDPPVLTDGNGAVLYSASANPTTGVVWAAGTTYINGTSTDPQIIGYFANGVWNSVTDTVNNQNYSYNALAASVSEVDVMTYQSTAEKNISGNWQSVNVQGSLSGSHLWGMNVIPGVNAFWAVGVDNSGNTLTEQYTPPPPLQLTKLSSDPYTNSTSQHKTEVEPDTFSFGSTIVSAFQVSRFANLGGSDNIGWATSSDNGATWKKGFLKGITKIAGGIYNRVSDPVVAYDAAHQTWMIVSIGIVINNGTIGGTAVLVSRSSDGLTWNIPVVVGSSEFFDKPWIVCDNTASSQYYGHCYIEWDDGAEIAGNLIVMATSTNGGTTWVQALTADNAQGLGGQPLVQPNGNVVVPYESLAGTIAAFKSTDGGTNWGASVTVTQIQTHTVTGGLRTEPLPSAEIDGSGKVYVVWQDCRFESNCSANDIVMSTSTDGTTWSAVKRIPINPVGSGVDHFIPGLAVDKSTSGSSTHLVLVYYYYPVASCSTNCQLDIGFVSSTNGGTNWTAKTRLAGPMTLTWLAKAPTISPSSCSPNCWMVGDYISTSFSGGVAYSVFAVAKAPSGGLLNEAMYTVVGGLR